MLKAITVQRLHLWCGLLAALWLMVLGVSGFILDHRDGWRWLWQSGVNPAWLPQAIMDKRVGGSVRLYQLSPHDAGVQLSGGMTGLWWRTPADSHWQAARFNGRSGFPLVYQILFDEHTPGRVWLATDDGLWLSEDNGKQLWLHSFEGQVVTALARDGGNRLYAVIDRGRLYGIDTTTDDAKQIDLRPPASATLPDSITLSRFVRDLHYGRGITSVAASRLWNDITGVALFVMGLSGFLFYWLPKRWRRRKAAGAAVNHLYKKHAMRWLFRLHAPVLGLISGIPLLYLAVTGIFLDHSTGLRQWMKQTTVSRAFQTPVYNISGWEGHIYGVAANHVDGTISLATRLGLFSSGDQGGTWRRETLWQDKAVFVWTLRQHRHSLLAGGMGSPNFIRRDGNEAWQMIKGHAHMPSDITVRGDAVLLKNRKGLWRIGNDLTAVKEPLPLPAINYAPWFYVIDGLHSGLLIHAQWKWVNDLIAVIAIILVITGLMRWWKTRWI